MQEGRWQAHHILVAVGLCVAVAKGVAAQSPAPQSASASVDSARVVHQPDLRVRLIDQRTRAPLRRRVVTVYSDNGRRCLRAPCATNGTQWDGRTDSTGVVVLPGRLRQESMHVWTTGYRTRVDLVDKAVRRTADLWVVALRRDRK